MTIQKIEWMNVTNMNEKFMIVQKIKLQLLNIIKKIE